MKFGLVLLSAALLLWGAGVSGQERKQPTLATPLVVVPEVKEVRVTGTIYPERFNAAQGEEAHYHFLVWKDGTSPYALIETPVDDLDFYDALLKLSGKPGNNLTMAAWNERHDEHSLVSRKTVTGSWLDIHLSWETNPIGIPAVQAFQHSFEDTPDPRPQTLDSRLEWRFGGNRNRWFNLVPLAPRPGCLVCLYSCPSGKVSNGALSIHDYVTAPSRFAANTDILPADGTPVVVSFRLLP